MLTRVMLVIVFIAAVGLIGGAEQGSPAEPAAFVAYYWKARPGKLIEYNDYITKVAVPIDEDAFRRGSSRMASALVSRAVTGRRDRALATRSDWRLSLALRKRRTAAAALKGAV